MLRWLRHWRDLWPGFRPAMAALLLAMPALLAMPGPLRAQTATETELRSIRFEGARAFPEALLRAAILSNASTCKNPVLEFIQVCRLGIGRTQPPVDTIALQSDVLRLRYFYYERGYREAQVVLDTVVAGRILNAIYRIKEGEPVRVDSIELAGLDDLAAETRLTVRGVLDRLPLQRGDPLSMIAYEAARDTLLNRLHNLGYASADVFARYRIPPGLGRSAFVGYDLAPGEQMFFAAPDIRGSDRVSRKVILRMLAFRAGDAYSRDAILRSQRNLFGLDMFRNIDIRTDSTTGNTIIPVVEVEEAPLNRVRLGMGISSVDFLNVEGRWAAHNFMGGARRLEVRARLANMLADQLEPFPLFESTRHPFNKLSGSLALDFTRPWFLNLRNSIGTGLFWERRSIPDVYVRTTRGGYVAITRTLGPGTTASLGYRPEFTELDAEDEIFCVTFIACEAGEIKLLSDPHLLAPITFSFGRDRSNSLFTPTAGYTFRLEAEYAAGVSGSEFAYTRLSGEWTTYNSIGNVVLAARIRPGWAHALNLSSTGLGLHPQKRFFAGGPNSVRGFGQYRLGPKLLTTAVENVLDTLDQNGFTGCTAEQINTGGCDVSKLADGRPHLFEVRPVGGAVSFEGNLEARFPLFGGKLGGAAFVDLGQVWTADARVRPSDLIWTPGIGLRYLSPIGPIRIDVGYNSQGAEQLQVLTNKVCADGDTTCSPDALTPLGRVPWGANRKFWDRLQLHFSIGQAF